MGVYANQYIPNIIKEVRPEGKNEVGFIFRTNDDEGRLVYRQDEFEFIYSDNSSVTVSSLLVNPGDMFKSTYDTNDDGIVDSADNIAGTPGTYEYYGTEGTTTKGFYSLPAGNSPPDNETIEINGSNQLKVSKHTYYDTSVLSNVLNVGNGIVQSATTDISYPTGDCIAINTDSGSTTILTNVHNSVVIGDNISIGTNLSRANSVNDCIVIAPGLNFVPSSTINNATVLAAKGSSTSSDVMSYASNTVNLGIAPTNKVSDSTAIGFPRKFIGAIEECNTLYFIQGLDLNTTGTANAVINIDLSLITSNYSYVKVKADVFGVSYITPTNYYTASSETTIVNGSVLADTTTTPVIDNGQLSGTSHANTFSTGVLTTTITPAVTAAESYNWYATYQIIVIDA